MYTMKKWSLFVIYKTVHNGGFTLNVKEGKQHVYLHMSI